MRAEEFFARLDKIEGVLDGVKHSPSDPSKWAALIAIAYPELRWATKLMRHCSAGFLDEKVSTASVGPSPPQPKPRPGSFAAALFERLDLLEKRQMEAERRQKETEARLADAEISGVWAIPVEDPGA